MTANTCPDVGAILKSAREVQKLSVQEVADQLHLRPSIVVAIENNSFGELPGITFLKGYLKSYARLLKLSESEMLSHLQQALDLESAIADDVVRQRQVSKPRASLLVLLVLVGVLSAGIFWSVNTGVITLPNFDDFWPMPGASNDVESPFSGQGGEKSDGVSIPQNDEDNIVSVPKKTGQPTKDNSKLTFTYSHQADMEQPPGTSIRSVDIENEEIDSIDGGAGRGDLVSEVVVPDELVVADTIERHVVRHADKNESTAPEDDLLEEPTNIDEVAREDRPVLIRPTMAITPTADTSLDVPVPIDQQNSVEAAIGEIVANFSGDCWFQVKNGDGRVVLAALKHDGDTVSYTGILPFQVVIGAVSEVQLSFNGAPVDFSHYRVRSNRTDFILE